MGESTPWRVRTTAPGTPPGCGGRTGSTARTPKSTLSFEMSMCAAVTLPTGMTWVQYGLGRVAPDAPRSRRGRARGPRSHARSVSLVSCAVTIAHVLRACPGAWASDHERGARSPAPRGRCSRSRRTAAGRRTGRRSRRARPGAGGRSSRRGSVKRRRRVALLEERDVVAAAQVPVAPVDHPDVHARAPGSRRRLRTNRASWRGGRVVLAADRLPDGGLRPASREVGTPSAKSRTRCGSRRAVVGRAGADDVVGEHPLDVGAGGLELLGAVNVEPYRPCSSPATAAKHDGRVGRARGHHPGQLQRHRRRPRRRRPRPGRRRRGSSRR